MKKNIPKTEGKTFSEQELQTIAQKIIDAGYPQKTRELAQTYLDEAEKHLQGFSGTYKTMLAEAITYIKERKK